MGPIAFILVFLIIPLAAGLIVLVFLAAALAAKAFAALPVVVWGLVVAVLVTGGMARHRLGRRRERGIEVV